MRRRTVEATVVAALLALAAGTATAQCIGDANNNGFVNFADYGAVAANFGQPCSPETRFVDNLNGTITDGWTGLMWEKKIKLDQVVDVDVIQDADNYFVWSGDCSGDSEKLCQPDPASSNACFAGAEGRTHGCGLCGGTDGQCETTGSSSTIWQWLVALNASGFAGHSDWRVPTNEELQQLLSLKGEPFPYCVETPCTHVAFQSASCGSECSDIGSASCSCTQQASYWTASSNSGFGEEAWAVSFQTGRPGISYKVTYNFVRAVRSEN